jgi:YidC/Oxa1 family membrane protein insertase
MGRQEIIGFVLIFVVLMIWMWMNTPQPQPAQRPPASESIVDTPKASHKQLAEKTLTAAHREQETSEFFSSHQKGEEKVLIVETDQFIAEISTKGGMLRKWELKNYKTWDGFPVQLVDFDGGGDYTLLFTTTDGKLVNTKSLFFDAPFKPWQRITLRGEDTYELDLTLRSSRGGMITKTYRFTNGRYDFRSEYKLTGMSNIIANFEYQVVWENGLRYAEENSVDESSFAAAFVHTGGELIEVDAGHSEVPVQKDMVGMVDWVAARTKYFAVALIPGDGETQGAYIEGKSKPLPEHGIFERYSVAVKVPYKGEVEERRQFTVFLGPLEYSTLKEYGKSLESVMSLGWVWIVRPISVYVMLPLLGFLRWFIPNWGIVIIVFSIIIKIVLHPLTKSSMKAMKKMQALQPMMNEIREKYKDDPGKMNQAIMNLYKEYGVNPAGGCLPLLLQFPILIALYNVFRGAIELRQSSFVWWINDLSVPDKLVSLPSALPLLGMKDISGLALLMGITMFIQQKMTVKDPRQKMMVWLMPVMMTILFNAFPSGLNLYYFTFNLLSIGQQMLMNRKPDEPLRKVDQKKRSGGGIFGRVTKDLPRFKR